jgi:hypothetical protein
MNAKSPSRSLSRDRRVEIGFLQGSPLDEVSNYSAFMISLRFSEREISPLDTPKEKRKA